ERAVGVDGEVDVRVRRRPVVRGLSGGMDHELQRARVLREYAIDTLTVADVEIERSERVAERPHEALGGRCGRCRGAEELRAHVVVKADHVEAGSDEMLYRFGPDQAAGSSDDGGRHEAVRLASGRFPVPPWGTG